jgi:imidazoleglycerol-phosphate dehydratase
MEKKMGRICIIKRKTKETEINLSLNIDGSGKVDIDTGLGILDHMLELFSFHGFFDLKIKAKSDLKKIDLHHINEDIGIVLGEAFKKALGDKKGIRRFGFFACPMEENLALVSLDISGRAYFNLVIDTQLRLNQDRYSLEELKHFLDSFTKHLGMNLYIILKTSQTKDIHSIMEPIFKALGIALDQATQIEPRRKGIPSIKGIID